MMNLWPLIQALRVLSFSHTGGMKQSLLVNACTLAANNSSSADARELLRFGSKSSFCCCSMTMQSQTLAHLLHCIVPPADHRQVACCHSRQAQIRLADIWLHKRESFSPCLWHTELAFVCISSVMTCVSSMYRLTVLTVLKKLLTFYTNVSIKSDFHAWCIIGSLSRDW